VLYDALAIAIGYVLGSLPSAYLATWLAVRRDVRTLGGGNVGGLNVYREVGLLPAMAVALLDIGKGVLAVAAAYWWLKVPEAFVLAAAVAVVIGHNWMLFLKFTGGKGMAPAIGGLAVLFIIYGYPLGIGIFLGLVIIIVGITRNVALAMGIGLFSLPFIAAFGMKPFDLYFLIYTLALGAVILVKFFPTARRAVSRAGNIRDFIFDRWQRNRRRPHSG